MTSGLPVSRGALEARQNSRPSLGDAIDDNAVVCKPFMGQGQLDEFTPRLKPEGDARGMFFQGSLVQDMVEGVGQPPRPVSL
jgi:hypothetical protein